ncbi:unannotated protein [freshwater metagenome]|uniref:Unannotated protein n=1 Tax=freshwater metagenome TaxID=449393 RepID=A0A6J7ECL3_9ZZZZ
MQFRGGVGPTQHGLDVLLDEVGLPLLDEQNRALALAESDDLVVNDRIGDVHNVERDVAVAVRVGQAQQFEGTIHVVEQAALEDDPEVLVLLGHELIEAVVLDVLNRGRPALVDLLLLVQKARRGEHNATEIVLGVLEGLGDREIGPPVVLCGERSVQVAGPQAQFEDDRGVADLGELEAFFDHVNDRGEIRARVQKPHLRLHGEGMGSLLHDARALAVVLADDDERAPEDAPG